MTDVFISYAKADNEDGKISTIAEKLRGTASRVQDDITISVWIDEEGIRASEHWAKEIELALEKTHTFAAFISSRYFASLVCNQELEKAQELGKKVIPIWIEEVSAGGVETEIKKRQAQGKAAAPLSHALGNYGAIENSQAIRYDTDTSPYKQKSLERLIIAIFENAPLDDGATEWLGRALANERGTGGWLTGADLIQAEQWLEEASKTENFKVRDETKNFIVASRKAENRRRVTLGFVGILTLIVITVAGIIAWQQAEQSRRSEMIANSRALSNQVVEILKDSQFDLALLLSVEAIQQFETGESLNAIATSLQNVGVVGSYLYEDVLGFSLGGQKLITASESGEIVIWDVSKDYAVRDYSIHVDPIQTGILSWNGNLVIVAESEGDIVAYNMTTGDTSVMASISLGANQVITQLEINKTNTELLVVISTTDEQRNVSVEGILLDIETGNLLQSIVADTQSWNSLFKFANHENPILIETRTYRDLELSTLNITDIRSGNHILSYTGAFTETFGRIIELDTNNTSLALVQYPTIMVWDLLNLEVTNVLDIALFDDILSMSFNHNGSKLVISTGSLLGGNSSIAVWNLSISSIINEPYTYRESAIVNFAPDDQFIVFTSCASRAVRSTCLAGKVEIVNLQQLGDLWEIRTVDTFNTTQWHTNDIIFSQDGNFFVTSDTFSNNSALFEIVTESVPPPMKRYSIVSDVSEVVTTSDAPSPCDWPTAISPDGTFISCVQTIQRSYDSANIMIFDIKNQEQVSIPIIDASLSYIRTVVFSPDSSLLASMSRRGYVDVWELETFQLMYSIDLGADALAENIEFNSNAELILVQMGTNTRIWELQTGSLVLELHDEIMPFFGLDPGILYTSDGTNRRIWDVNTGEITQAFPLRLDFVNTLGEQLNVNYAPVFTVSPSRRLAAGSSGGRSDTTVIWDYQTGQQLGRELAAVNETQFATSHAFSHDEKLLAVAVDFGVLIWDIESQNQIGEFFHIATPTAIRFHLDERILFVFTGLEYRQIDLRTTTLIQQACRIANRDFTAKEWSSLFPNEPYRETCSDVGDKD